MKKVVVIVGPTGSGKTGLSVKLAKIFGSEIINGDSVQVYQGLDIGSAKITKDEMDGVKHHLLDMVSPKDTYSVFQFQQDVRLLIDQIDRPIICGGTGLYIKAALYDYEFDEGGRDESFDQRYQDVSIEDLEQELLALDPDITIDFKNRRRVLRALELAQSGIKRSMKQNKDHLLYDALILYLDIERDVLEPKLRTRLDRMIDKGFIEEVRALDQQGIRVNAIGYREMNQYVDGLSTLVETKEEIVKVTKKLAKKQKTFFKNQMEVIMLDALDPSLLDQARALITRFYGGSL
jgi:tRNA dimethylallyltransferase